MREPVIQRTEQPVPMVESTRIHTYSPGNLLAAIVGGVVLAFGIITLVRTGVDSDVTQPATTILGVTHTAGVGIVEVVAGVLILVAALLPGSVVGAGLLGMLAVIAGIVALFSSAQLQHDVGFDHTTGWWFIIWGGVAILAALLPVIWRRERRLEPASTMGFDRPV